MNLPISFVIALMPELVRFDSISKTQADPKGARDSLKRWLEWGKVWLMHSRDVTCLFETDSSVNRDGLSFLGVLEMNRGEHWLR